MYSQPSSVCHCTARDDRTRMLTPPIAPTHAGTRTRRHLTHLPTSAKAPQHRTTQQSQQRFCIPTLSPHDYLSPPMAPSPRRPPRGGSPASARRYRRARHRAPALSGRDLSPPQGSRTCNAVARAYGSTRSAVSHDCGSSRLWFHSQLGSAFARMSMRHSSWRTAGHALELRATRARQCRRRFGSTRSVVPHALVPLALAPLAPPARLGAGRPCAPEIRISVRRSAGSTHSAPPCSHFGLHFSSPWIHTHHISALLLSLAPSPADGGKSAACSAVARGVAAIADLNTAASHSSYLVRGSGCAALASFIFFQSASSVPGRIGSNGSLRQRRAATSNVRLAFFLRGRPECGRHPPLHPFFPIARCRDSLVASRAVGFFTGADYLFFASCNFGDACIEALCSRHYTHLWSRASAPAAPPALSARAVLSAPATLSAPRRALRFRRTLHSRRALRSRRHSPLLAARVRVLACLCVCVWRGCACSVCVRALCACMCVCAVCVCVPCVCASVRVRVCVHSTPRAPIGPELAARRSRDAPTLVVCGGLLPLAIARSTRRRRRRAGAASRLARHGPRESYTATVATTSRARRQAVTPLPPQRAGVPELIHPTDPTWLVENTHDSHGLHGCPEPEVAADVVATIGTGRSTAEPGSPSHASTSTVCPTSCTPRSHAREGGSGGGR